MILLIERDVRKHPNALPWWKPLVFRGTWEHGRTWRIGWGNWSLSYYPSRGMREFMWYISSGNTCWYEHRRSIQASEQAEGGK
jgi:hypothetical protein